MPEFVYEGRTSEGRPISGSIDATTRSVAGQSLKKQGLFITRLAPAEASNPDAPRAAPSATHAEVALQVWQLSVMVDTGIGLADALVYLARQAARPNLKALLEELAARVRDGSSLSEAMARHPNAFPPSLIALVRASEISGTLGATLRRASQYMTSDVQLQQKLKGVAAYPIIMLTLCLSVAAFLLVFVLPQFSGIFAANDAALPAPTRLLMAVSQSLTAHWHLWLAALATLGITAFLWLRSSAGRRQLDAALITAPVLSDVVNPLLQSRSFRTLAALLDAHVPLDESVAVVRDIVPNDHYRELWAEIEEQIHVGESFAAPFLDRTFIPEPIAQVIANGDRTGKLSLAFAHLAEYTEAEHNRTLGNITRLAEPVMVILIGGFIGFVAIALLLPLFQVGRVMGGGQ